MKTFFATAILLASTTASAAPAAPTFGCPANMAEYHQFDFWIGKWEVRDPTGKNVLGHSRIEAVSDGWASPKTGVAPAAATESATTPGIPKAGIGVSCG